MATNATIAELKRLFSSNGDEDIRGFLVRNWNDPQITGCLALDTDREKKVQLRAFWRDRTGIQFYLI